MRFGQNLYQLLPNIWNFVLGLKSLLWNCPKYLTWPNMSKKTPKNALLLWQPGFRESEGLNFCIEFAYSFGQTLGKSDSKKTIKNRDHTFYWSSFPTPKQFLLFWWRYQYTHFSSTLGRCIQQFCNISGEREPSYPPTSFYRQYFILDNVLLIKGSRKNPLKMWPLYLLMYLEMSNERIFPSIFTVFTPWFLQIGSNQAEISEMLEIS